MEKQCFKCGEVVNKPYYTSKKVWKLRKYCSNKCKGLALRGRIRKLPTMKNCIICGKSKTIRPYRVGTFKFCSPKCKGVSMIGYIPWNKNTKGLMPTPWNKGKEMPKELVEKLRLANKGHIPWNKGLKGIVKMKRGKDSPLWRGGKRGLHKEIRQSTEYKQWREQVFERDNWTCLICGIRGGNGKKVILNADHIQTFAYILDKHGIDSAQKALICSDLWDIANGRTLCISCHMNTNTWGRNITNLYN